jgi:DnaJ family protein C protein 13
LQVQKAYERLQAGAAGGQGPQPWRLLLMLRAQCILFRRYAAVLAPFKYAGYPQLLEVLRQQQVAAEGVSAKASIAASGTGAAAAAAAAAEQYTGAAAVNTTSSSSHFLSGERISQVLAAIELCWLTCVASRRNAEELLRSGGLPLLSGLLTRCASDVLLTGLISTWRCLQAGCSCMKVPAVAAPDQHCKTLLMVR